MKNIVRTYEYKVMSYDGRIEKWYKNYQSAYNCCVKLIGKDIMCGIYQWNNKLGKMDMIIGC